MSRTICVPIDGSEFSLRALGVVEAIAREDDVVDLVTAVEPIPPFPIPRFSEAAEAWMAKRQAEVRTRLHGTVGTITETALLINPALGVVEHVTASRPDVVVMATHGRGPLRRAWIGSVTDRVIRHGGCPVLVIHPGEALSDPLPPIRQVLVPHDGSAVAGAALDGATLVFGTDVRIVLLRVLDPTSDRDAVPGLDVARAEQELRDAAARRGIRAGTRVVTSRRVSDEIARAARETRSDAIAMGTHGRGGLARVALGSVADQVLRRTTGMVLVVPPRRSEPAPA